MLSIKYKLIPVTMGIALLLSTGTASIVNASPINRNPINRSPINTRHQVNYRQYYNESFTAELDMMVATGFINSYQELRVFDIFIDRPNFNYRDNFNPREIFRDGLDNLVATGAISSYQASRILDAFNNSAQPMVPGPAPVQPVAPSYR